MNGSTSGAQREWLRAAAAGCQLAGETGFGAGGSATALLSANETIRVVSFELAATYGVQLAKHAIDGAYPGRHRLVGGDSRVTVPAWDGGLFGLFFVDGDHSRDGATADLEAALAVTRPGGLIVIDDLTPWKPWGQGPSHAWLQLAASGRIGQVRLFADPAGDRVWGAGLVADGEQHGH